MDIVGLCIASFLSQFFFIGIRTWNIKAIAEHNIFQVLLSGFLIHLAWLISITIGVTSMKELMINFQPVYLFVVVSSASGGLLSSYIVMKRK